MWTDNFYFVIGSDCQFGYIWPHKERDDKDWKIEMEKSICAIEKINNLSPRPQFVVICGDLVNEMPYRKLKFNIIIICFLSIIVYFRQDWNTWTSNKWF